MKCKSLLDVSLFDFYQPPPPPRRREITEHEHREREERENLLRERQRLEMERQKLERERLERERLERERVRIEQVLWPTEQGYIWQIFYNARCTVNVLFFYLIYKPVLNKCQGCNIGNGFFCYCPFRNDVKKRSVSYENVRSCGGSRNNFAMSRKRETTWKEAVKWNTGMNNSCFMKFKKCN